MNQPCRSFRVKGELARHLSDPIFVDASDRVRRARRFAFDDALRVGRRIRFLERWFPEHGADFCFRQRPFLKRWCERDEINPIDLTAEARITGYKMTTFPLSVENLFSCLNEATGRTCPRDITSSDAW